jgi:hypothetical protein
MTRLGSIVARMSNNAYVPPLAGQGTHPLPDPHIGSDDHHSEVPDGASRNVPGNVALVAALVGLAAVWALQDSLDLIGFGLSGIALVTGGIAVLLPGRRRASAVGALVVGAAPFLFTAARLVLGF